MLHRFCGLWPRLNTDDSTVFQPLLYDAQEAARIIRARNTVCSRVASTKDTKLPLSPP